ncbi:hypothetical protein GGP85_002911 [Salinibacter ruber]|jgi:hypothetical protein|uniref:HK97 gp10 family phage protein n=1 Tax=Salinibacter ruber TaxID=146919 RepID=UPI0021686A61|nr:HK97 gp10 family phage protein [Salinibacter ruber]MCS3827441.1 hypothetical protein [Salinibacter ruber]
MIETNASGVADDVLSEFDDFTDDVDEEIDRALREAKELARRRVPVDEGDLRDDISIDLNEDRIYNTLEYAVYQNYGTIYIEPTFYLTDSALDAWRSSIDRLQSR